MNDSWVAPLYTPGNMSQVDANTEYCKVVSSVERNMRSLQYSEARMRGEAQTQRQQSDRLAVRAAAQPFLSIPAGAPWLESFQQKRDRCEFLVLNCPPCGED